MNVYAAILLNFLPLIACLVCFALFIKTKITSEFFACLLGLLAVLPITFVQFYFLTFFPEELFANNLDLSKVFLKMLIFNGFIEETIKTLFMFLLPSKKTTFAQFFSLTLLSGLSLGCFESMIYFLQHLQKVQQQGPEAQLLYGLIFARMFSSDLIHTFCAGLCGFLVWNARKKRLQLSPFILAVVIHGVFNFFVYFNNNIRYFAIPAILLAIIECRIYFQKNCPVLLTES